MKSKKGRKDALDRLLSELPPRSSYPRSILVGIRDEIPYNIFRTLRDYIELFYGVGIYPEIEKGMRFLDVGCATGEAVYDLARILGPKGLAVGIDKYPRFKERSQGPGEAAVRLIPRVAENLRFKNNSFDAIFCVFSFDYLEDKVKAIGEMLRILKRGGAIYLVTKFSDILVVDSWTEQLANLSIETRDYAPWSRVGHHYNLAQFLHKYFSNIEIDFQQGRDANEYYSITKLSSGLNLKEKLPSYKLVIPYAVDDVTSFLTVAVSQK